MVKKLGRKSFDDDFNEEIDSISQQLAEKADMTDIESVVEKRKLIDFVRYGELSLPNDFPVDLGFKIFRKPDGKVYHNYDFAKFDVNVTKIYISHVNGVDTNDGLTELTAIKTFYRAMEITGTLAVDVRAEIIFLDKFVNFYTFFTGYTPSGSAIQIPITRNVTLKSNLTGGSYVFWGNYAEGHVWAAHTVSGVYTTVRSGAKDVIDYDAKDILGFPTVLKKALTLAECETTKGTWFLSGTTVYVHRENEEMPTGGNVAIPLNLANYFYFYLSSNVNMFIDNMHFWVGNGETRSAFNALGTDSTAEIVLRKCSASKGVANGFTVNKIGRTLSFECTSFGNGDDGFNYHGVIGDGITEFAFEYDCYSFGNGYEGKSASNATTAHEEMAVLRINSIGHSCYGPLLADVNSCFSVNIDCVMHDKLGATGSNLAFYINDSASEKTGKMYLINCSGGGGTTGTVGAGGTKYEIYAKNLIGNNIADDLVINLLD